MLVFVVLSAVEGNTGEEKIKHRAYFTDPGYTFEYSQQFAFDPFTPFPELSKNTPGPTTPKPVPTTPSTGPTTPVPRRKSAAPESSHVTLKAKKKMKQGDYNYMCHSGIVAII